MKYTYKNGKKSTVKITITLNAEEWANAQKKAYEKNKGKFNIPGFRKGHVPMHVVEQNYGKGVFFEDAINLAFPEYYYDILDKEPSIEAVDRPEIDIDKLDDNGITLVATVPVKPEVKIEAYKGIKVKKVEYNVTDAEVDAEVTRLLERNSKEVAVTDRACENGDITVIDYSGSIDGKKFDGGTAEKQNLTLGSNMFIPGFEDQVVGMNIGDEKDINVKFPDDYGATELKGKEAVFHVKLHEIKKKELPELTDAFIKDATGDESVEAYKKATREKLQEANNKKAEMEIEDNLINAICDKAEVEIPEALVERQIDNMVQDMEYRMMYSGIKMDDYLKYLGKTKEEFRKGYKEQAEKQVKSQLVIDKILKEEKIEASEDEINAKIKEQAEKAGKEFEEYKKSVDDRQKDYIENGIVIEKLFKFLKENNQID